MPLTAFDHVNVRTSNLDAMIAWYQQVLGLSPGFRPKFSFPGAWMYLGDRPVVHLVSVAEPVGPRDGMSLEHFAFRAEDMDGMRQALEDNGVDYTVDPVPGLPLVQLNFCDPDGNHNHVDFDTSESAA